jgi:hypothetical protein
METRSKVLTALLAGAQLQRCGTPSPAAITPFLCLDSPAGNALGCSLVYHLCPKGQKQQHPLLPVITALRNRIEEVLPGVYSWMNDDALHCTLRALM